MPMLVSFRQRDIIRLMSAILVCTMLVVKDIADLQNEKGKKLS